MRWSTRLRHPINSERKKKMTSRLMAWLLMELFITASSPVFSTQQNFAIGRRLKFDLHLSASSSWFTLVAIPEVCCSLPNPATVDSLQCRNQPISPLPRKDSRVTWYCRVKKCTAAAATGVIQGRADTGGSSRAKLKALKGHLQTGDCRLPALQLPPKFTRPGRWCLVSVL